MTFDKIVRIVDQDYIDIMQISKSPFDSETGDLGGTLYLCRFYLTILSEVGVSDGFFYVTRKHNRCLVGITLNIYYQSNGLRDDPAD